MKGLVQWNILVVVAVVSLIGIAVVMPGVLRLPGDLMQGATTLSLSQVNFVSNDPQLNGQAWLLNVVADSSGQFNVGNFKASQVTADGKTATNDFSINYDIDKNTITYPIYSTAETVYLIQNVKVYPGGVVSGMYFWQKPPEQDCIGSGGTYVKPVQSFDTYCVMLSPAGVLGSIQTGSYSFQATVSVQKTGGNLILATINNYNSPSAKLGDVGYVNWVGNLVTGEAIPSAQGSDVCALFVGNQWKTVSCTSVAQWRNAYANWQNCFVNLQAKQSDPDYCKNIVNSPYSSIIQGKTWSVSGGTVSRTEGGLTSGNIVFDLSKQYQMPMMTLKIKADYLGVSIPVSKPDVTYAISDKFRTGSDGLIKATIKNVGDGLGSFDVSAVCDSPFSSNDRVRITLDKGAQTDVWLKVNAAVQQTTTGSCRVTATDVNQPGNTDYQIVTVTADTIVICQEGQKRAVGGLVQQCQNNIWITIKECTPPAVADPITFNCVNAGGSTQPVIQFDWLKMILEGIVIATIITIIVFVLGFIIPQAKGIIGSFLNIRGFFIMIIGLSVLFSLLIISGNMLVPAQLSAALM